MRVARQRARLCPSGKGVWGRGETPEPKKGIGFDGELVVFFHLPAGAPRAFLSEESGVGRGRGSFFHPRLAEGEAVKSEGKLQR